MSIFRTNPPMKQSKLAYEQYDYSQRVGTNRGLNTAHSHKVSSKEVLDHVNSQRVETREGLHPVHSDRVGTKRFLTTSIYRE